MIELSRLRTLSGCGGMADAVDSKSTAREGVRVRVPPSALIKSFSNFISLKVYFDSVDS